MDVFDTLAGINGDQDTNVEAMKSAFFSVFKNGAQQ